MYLQAKTVTLVSNLGNYVFAKRFESGSRVRTRRKLGTANFTQCRKQAKESRGSADKGMHGVLTQHDYPLLETLRDGCAGRDGAEAFDPTRLRRSLDRRRRTGGRVLVCGPLDRLEAGSLVFP